MRHTQSVLEFGEILLTITACVLHQARKKYRIPTHYKPLVVVVMVDVMMMMVMMMMMILYVLYSLVRLLLSTTLVRMQEG